DIDIPNETEVINVIMEALKRTSTAADLAQSIWRQANTLRVRRAKPILTARGKLMPLQVAKKKTGSISNKKI
ncbi:hypothetical protein ACFL1Z_09525, partial [Thermodesulfobacteriota bacterium]